jgi:hypothetical protein
MKRSQFVGCTANAFGGAVSVQSSQTVQFVDTLFVYNQVLNTTSFGAALYANLTKEILVNNCTFSRNTVRSLGGLAFLFDLPVLLS